MSGNKLLVLALMVCGVMLGMAGCQKAEEPQGPTPAREKKVHKTKLAMTPAATPAETPVATPVAPPATITPVATPAAPVATPDGPAPPATITPVATPAAPVAN